MFIVFPGQKLCINLANVCDFVCETAEAEDIKTGEKKPVHLVVIYYVGKEPRPMQFGTAEEQLSFFNHLCTLAANKERGLQQKNQSGLLLPN